MINTIVTFESISVRRIAYGEDHQQKEPDSPRPWSPEPGEPSDSSHYSSKLRLSLLLSSSSHDVP